MQEDNSGGAMVKQKLTEFIIRSEEAADFAEISALIYTSFLRAQHRDGTEQDLVGRLRTSAAFVPELALVAEQGQNLIGYLLLSEISIGKQTALALAPLAVIPRCQKQGVGAALIKRGHELARKLGYPCIVVLRSDSYYPKFGYQPAEKFGIIAPFEVPSNYFMVYPLGDNLTIQGQVNYPPEFKL